MIKRTISGIAVANIDNFYFYQNRKSKVTDKVICGYVFENIYRLPWYFFIPIVCMIFIIGLSILIINGYHLDSLQPNKRIKILNFLKKLPFFKILNKLILTLTYLKLFDEIDLPNTSN